MIGYSVLGVVFFCASLIFCVTLFLQIFFRMELHNLKKRKPKNEKGIPKWEKRMAPLVKKVNQIQRVFIISLAVMLLLFLILCLYTAKLQIVDYF